MKMRGAEIMSSEECVGRGGNTAERSTAQSNTTQYLSHHTALHHTTPTPGEIGPIPKGESNPTHLDDYLARLRFETTHAVVDGKVRRIVWGDETQLALCLEPTNGTLTEQHYCIVTIHLA